MSSQKSEFTLGAPFWLALAAMIAVIVVSNFLVLRPIPALDSLLGWPTVDEYGDPMSAFNFAQFTFPVAFLITDIINRLFGAQFARRIAGLAFLVAVPFSIFVNGVVAPTEWLTPWLPAAFGAPFAGGAEGMQLQVWTVAVQIGLASGLAFIVGQLLDITVFQWLRQQAWWIAPLAGSIIASLIDTAIFYGFAFAGEPWVISAGMVDFTIKVIVALVALLPFRLVIARALSQDNAAK